MFLVNLDPAQNKKNILRFKVAEELINQSKATSVLDAIIRNLIVLFLLPV